MATSEMDYMNVGGAIYYEHPADIVGNSTYTVNCGFKARHIIVACRFTNGGVDYAQSFVYDADTSTTTFQQIAGNAVERDITPTMNYYGFGEIEDGYFTIKNVVSTSLMSVYILATEA